MRIGIDVGGTKIEGVILDDAGGELHRARVATPHTGYSQVVEAIAEVALGLEEHAAPNQEGASRPTVGVATPGFLSPREGVILNSNLSVLNGRRIDADLTRRLQRPVRVENDANCFVLSEASDGAAAPSEQHGPGRRHVVFGATLGTGVGGGLVIDGDVWGGANGSAGEWSHTTLPFWRPEEDGPGSGCGCGHTACIESFLSGKGLAWEYDRIAGEKVSAVEVGDRASRNEVHAATTFERYEDRLARALAGVINLLDPNVIVLGGGISNNLRLFDDVPWMWERYTIAKELNTRLVRARHGDASGVRGAAWLWPIERLPEPVNGSTVR